MLVLHKHHPRDSEAFQFLDMASRAREQLLFATSQLRRMGLEKEVMLPSPFNDTRDAIEFARWMHDHPDECDGFEPFTEPEEVLDWIFAELVHNAHAWQAEWESFQAYQRGRVGRCEQSGSASDAERSS